MAVLEWITGIILTVMFLMAGGMKLMGTERAVADAERLGYSNLRQAIGGAEVLGAIGVIIGTISVRSLEWIGVLAGIGLILLMIGAVVYHNRAGDGPPQWAPAAGLGVVALLFVISLFGGSSSDDDDDDDASGDAIAAWVVSG